MDRPGRKRGTDPKKPGISDDKATVIVTADRKNGLNMTFCGHGRLTKKEIVESLNKPLPPDTILCSDGHVSYKGYASDNHLKHVVLRADLKQHVKKGGFHIQHINSLHNRLKKWIGNVFWGVSTKFLQNYLNWFYELFRISQSSLDSPKLSISFQLSAPQIIEEMAMNRMSSRL